MLFRRGGGGEVKEEKGLLLKIESSVDISGAPAREARGTEPHTHGIWSTSFRLVVT